MPTISMFFGIIIRMYLGKKEHNPPHFHAYYQNYKAIFDINLCEILEGEMPKKQRKLVEAWAELHKEELLANWELAINSEPPFKIEPLK
ncbi:MAG: DUF4160 domain-containing protein [Pseudomonadota bacterium]